MDRQTHELTPCVAVQLTYGQYSGVVFSMCLVCQFVGVSQIRVLFGAKTHCINWRSLIPLQ